MHMSRLIFSMTVLLGLSASPARAVDTIFFDPGQVITSFGAGTTTDTIRCEGYEFVYTRDKLFTGGGPEPIGRPVRVHWPDGIEAQYVTSGPNPGKARITIKRVDGAIFDLTSFTARLLANAGAGRAIEIVPMLDGEEPLNDPLYFDVSGNYWNEFSYDTTPNPWGSTAALVDYDTYIVTLTLDFALTALTLHDDAPASGVPDGNTPVLAMIHAAPNPANREVELSLSGPRLVRAGSLTIFSVRGVPVRTLPLDSSGRTAWDLRDSSGAPVPSGLYFVRSSAASHATTLQRVVVLR